MYNCFAGFIRESLFLTQAAWQNRLILIRTFSPLVIPIIVFIVFVGYNGGIVLGKIFQIHVFFSENSEWKCWYFCTMKLNTLSYLHFHIGAKEAHKVSPHFTQVLYFGAAAMFAVLPVHLDFVLIRENVEILSRAMQTRHINFLTSILVGSLACVHYFRYFFSYLFNQWYIRVFLFFSFIILWFSKVSM